MSDPFIAEIRIFAGNFAPRGWAFCSGQLLPIAQNTALFSLIGTTYGGDGRTTTALPNLQGRAAMHPGQGPGLTARRLGERSGTETVPLNNTQLPSHNHSVQATGDNANATSPESSVFASSNEGESLYAAPSSLTDGPLTQHTGGGQAHNNMQPFLAVNYIIAIQGLFPSRN
ncbi:MAG: tail fiber protein [Bacteroidota bacterium]